jgi:hypothetical protein
MSAVPEIYDERRPNAESRLHRLIAFAIEPNDRPRPAALRRAIRNAGERARFDGKAVADQACNE